MHRRLCGRMSTIDLEDVTRGEEKLTPNFDFAVVASGNEERTRRVEVDTTHRTCTGVRLRYSLRAATR
jgi:hypothetical protein